MRSRVEDRILELSNYDLLAKLINNASSKSEAISIAELGTSYKRTGFHFDKKLEKFGSDIKYLQRNGKLSFSSVTDSNLTHKLIIGDNYDALLNLSITYKEKIDVIYIDPPYGKDNMGVFADTNYNNAITRDNLLSMLFPRLVLAKQLLSEEGVIFCSIDDKNQAYLKCLFDDVFGESNFIASAPRKTGAGDAATRSNSELRKPYDYVLIYTNLKQNFEFKKILKGQKEYPYKDETGDFYLGQFQASGSDSTRSHRPNLYYPIYIQNDNTFSLEMNENTVKEILPNKVNGEDGRWMWNKEKFQQSSNTQLIYINNKIQRKIYFDPHVNQDIYQVEKALFEEKKFYDEQFVEFLDNSKYRNAEGTTLLNSILNKKALFQNPKPVELMKHLINLHPNKDATVLDFFAGSGTTGQAVLELNKEDGGSRQFILCTNNETTERNPNGIAYDVTSKRLKRVMTGECYDGTKNFEWIQKNSPLGGNLEVYDIAKVSNIEQEPGKSAFDVIDEKCYGEDFSLSVEEKIKWVCENFAITQKYLQDFEQPTALNSSDVDSNDNIEE